MQAILYLETNFLVSFAMGRNPEANALLTEPIGPILLAIPSVCFMEAFSVLKNEQAKSYRIFMESVRNQINEAKRNVVYPDFPSQLVDHLEAVLIDRELTFNLYKSLLYTAIGGLCATGEVIDSSGGVVSQSLSQIFVEDPTDNLILTTILRNAASQPSVVKAFLSENRKDFEGNPVAKEALNLAGIQCFSAAGHCLGYLNSKIVP